MRIIVILIFLILGTRLNAQPVNLVPNPSFEELTAYPDTNNLWPFIIDWFNPTGTSPDIYNSCSSGYRNIPYCANGFQNARTGVSFSGIFVYIDSSASPLGTREYIEVKLNTPLISNKTYSIIFYVNVPDFFFQQNGTIGCIGIYLSDYMIYNTSIIRTIPNIYPQIFQSCDQPIKDTMNWTKISGLYTSTGGELYLTIGNFYYDNYITWYTDNSNFDPKTGGQYFFIDDVGVYEVPDTIIDVPIINLPTAFSPNSDGKNDEFKLLGTPQNISNLTFCIFNRWGQRVFCNTNFYNGWDGTYKGEPCEIGSYVYTLSYTNTQTGKVEYKRGSVTLVR